MVFQRQGKISSTFTKLLPGFPASRVPKLNGFGGLCDGKIIVGYGRNLFEYKPNERIWTNHFINLNCKVDVDLGVGLETHMEGCSINNSQLLLCWDTQVHLFQCRKVDEQRNNVPNNISLHPSKRVRQKSALVSKTQSLNANVCLTRLPVSANGDTITSIGNNKVIFVGSYWVFEGELSTTENDVIWKKLEFPKTPRRCHMAFKLQDSVYIAGGYEQCEQEFVELSSCERYDLSEKTWNDCSHVLPYPLVCASVVVDKEETFAVIIGGYYKHEDTHNESRMIIIFTETDGFRVLEGNNLKSPRSSCHTSVRFND